MTRYREERPVGGRGWKGSLCAGGKPKQVGWYGEERGAPEETPASTFGGRGEVVEESP